MESTRDYYAVLGIRRTEDAPGIRSAFRRRVVQCHPGGAAEHLPRRLHEVVEAYRVLADPTQRKVYDEGIRYPAPATSTLDLRQRQPIATPLSLFDDFCAPRPAIAEVLERWTRNFTEIAVPKSEHQRPLDLDIHLAPEEVAQGGVVSIAVPMLSACPICEHSGWDWSFPCLTCDGQGTVEEERLIQLPIPERLRADSVHEVPLQRLGVHNLYLRVRLRAS